MLFALAWVVLGVVYVLAVRRKRPEAFDQRGFVLEGEATHGREPSRARTEPAVETV